MAPELVCLSQHDLVSQQREFFDVLQRLVWLVRLEAVFGRKSSLGTAETAFCSDCHLGVCNGGASGWRGRVAGQRNGGNSACRAMCGTYCGPFHHLGLLEGVGITQGSVFPEGEVLKQMFHFFLLQILLGKAEEEGLGGEVRHELHSLVWQAVMVAEQCLVISYVVGVLPAAFSSDPHLFVDTVRCVLSALCAAVSTCALLGLWTLHSHRARLRSLAGLLGSWQPCGSTSATAAAAAAATGGAGRGLAWSPRRAYASGTVVAFRGSTYRARGPLEANLAEPGSKAAAALQMLAAGSGWAGLMRWYGWAMALQTGVVGMMVLASALRKHYVMEVFVALLNAPAVLLFLLWRKDAVSAKD